MRRRRLVEVFGFVAVWVALGFLLPGSDETWLMSVPPTATTLDRGGLLLAGGHGAPVHLGSQILGDGDWSLIVWWRAANVRAGFAAFAIQLTSLLATLRSDAVPTVVGAGALTIGLGGIHVVTGTPMDGAHLTSPDV